MGTNTFRVLVAEETAPGELVERELHQEVVRLGQGLSSGGRLLPEAAARAEALLLRFRARLDALGATLRTGALTAAGREALDGADFGTRAARILGAEVRILEGDEEAELSAKGALSLLEGEDRDVLFLDIGGGSTEVVSLVGRRVCSSQSLAAGVVRIQEAVRPEDPPTTSDLRMLSAAARAALEPIGGSLDRDVWRRRLKQGRAVLVATAGTPLTVAAHVRSTGIADTRALTGTEVSREALDRMRQELGGLTARERGALPCMATGREDVILAGLALLCEFLRLFDAPGFTVSDGGLLEGLLLDQVERARGRASWKRIERR